MADTYLKQLTDHELCSLANRVQDDLVNLNERARQIRQELSDRGINQAVQACKK